MKPLSIYIHIPFCLKRCNYCDFLTFDDKNGHQSKYTTALINDIKQSSRAFKDYTVQTIFFGGGTPTALSAWQLSEILGYALENFSISSDVCITTEANPETICLAYLKELRQAGFNRLSIGVQSFDNDLLKLIGRPHDSKRAVSSILEAKEAGFDNINIDLMFSIPTQKIDDFENDLKTATSLPISHISTYSLIIEQDTPISKNKPLLKLIASDEVDREMYAVAIKTLKDEGFEHYETSNFAKKGKKCQHNITYWTGGEYVGYGLGASSYFNKVRSKKTDNLEDYIAGDFTTTMLEHIGKKEAMAEYFILGLRLIEGVSVEGFRRLFGVCPLEYYRDAFEKFAADGLVIIDNDSIRLSRRGIDLSNVVFREFL